MHLSNLNIQELIVQKTNEYLAINHTYFTLSANCLALKSLDPITQMIQQHLVPLLGADKCAISTALKLEMFKQQVQEDSNSALTDLHQAQEDGRYQQELLHERKRTHEDIVRANNAMGQLDVHSGLILVRLNELNNQIELRTQLLKQQQSSPTTHSHSTSVHSHNPSSGTIHQHSGGTSEIDANPQSVHSHSHGAGAIHQHSDADTRSAVFFDDEQLLALKREHSVLTNTLAKYREQRSHLAQSIDSSNRRREEIRLEQHRLAQEALNRHERQVARNTRAAVRIAGGDDSNLRQLSADNCTVLEQRVGHAHARLEQQFTEFRARAEQDGYTIYLTQLRQFLGSSHFTAGERCGLERIVTLMQDYMQQQQQEQHLRDNATQAEDRLLGLSRELGEKEQNVLRLQQQSPELSEHNLRLHRDINTLKLDRTERQRRNRSIIVAGSVFLVLSLVLVIIPPLIPFGVFSPAAFTVLFALATVTGTTTLGLFIAAAVYAIKNYSAQNSIESYEQTINTNERTITQNTYQVSQLTQYEIPTLQTAISHQQTVCAESQRVLFEFGQSMAGVLQEAQQIRPNLPAAQIVVVASSFNMFQPEIQPSAPPYEPDQYHAHP